MTTAPKPGVAVHLFLSGGLHTVEADGTIAASQNRPPLEFGELAAAGPRFEHRRGTHPEAFLLTKGQPCADMRGQPADLVVDAPRAV